MSPRVRPAARDQGAAVDAFVSRTLAPDRRTRSFRDGEYGPRSMRSWFLDMAWAGEFPALRAAAPPALVGHPAEARRRLAEVSRRDLNSGGTGLMPGSPSVPTFIAEE